MISTTGLPASLALKLVSGKRETFEAAIEKQPMNAREISAFRERISGITSVDDLVGDYEVYAFAMKAFGLEDQMFGKAMMKKVLVADADDRSSLINRLTDKRFLEIRKTFDFDAEGKAPAQFSDPEWVEGMVKRYVDQKLVESQLEQNEIVGMALHARNKAGSVKNWFNVLADPKLQTFFYTALGIPDGVKGSSVDAQAAMLEKRFDLEKLKDPQELERLVTRYSALAEAKAAQANLSSNPILQLVSGAGTGPSVVAINLSGLSMLKGGRYS